MKIHYEHDPAAAEPYRWHAWCDDFLISYDFVAYGATKHHAGFQLRRILGAPEEEEGYDEERG